MAHADSGHRPAPTHAPAVPGYDYTYEWDLATGVVARSAGFALATGHVDLPPTPDAWQPLVHPDDVPRLVPETARVLADPDCRAHTTTYRVRHADGRWLWLEDHSAIVRDPASGRALRVLAGVSIRRLPDPVTNAASDLVSPAGTAALAASEAHLRRLLALAGSAILEFDASGALVYANPAAERMLDTPVIALLGRRFDDPRWAVTAPDGAPMPSASLPVARALRGETVTGMEHSVRRGSDGARLVVEVSAVPIIDPADPARVIGVLSSVTDVTARWLALDAERTARRRTEVLQRLTAALGAARVTDDVARIALDEAAHALGYEDGTFCLLDADGAQFTTVRKLGSPDVQRTRWARFRNAPGIPAHDAVATRRPVILRDRAEYAGRYPALDAYDAETGQCGHLVYPLLDTDPDAGPRVLGILSFDLRRPRMVDDAEVRFLEALATVTAQALVRIALADAEREAHERVARAGRFLARVTAVAPDILYVHDLVARRNVWVNETIHDVLGLDQAETARRGAALMASLLHPDEATLIDAHYERLQALGDGEVATLTYRMRHADGGWRWLESREMIFRRGEAGRPVQIIGAATDVTERRRDEAEQARLLAAYRESEARFRAMHDASPDGVLLLGAVRDESGRIVDFAYRYANAVAHRLQAPGGPLAMGERLSQRQPSFRGSALFAAYVGVVESGHPYVDEVRYRGEWIDGTFRITAVRSAPDEIGVTFADVSDQVAALETARAANRAKAEFLATMSHELRTPLNAIQGHVHLLTMELHGPIAEAQRGALERIDRAQRHLLGIINDVLNYARLEAGRVEYTFAPVDLHTAVEEASALIEPQVTTRGLRLVRVPDAAADRAPVLARADRDKLVQVLLNLLSNAIKFSTPASAPETGVITVRILGGGAGAPWHVIEVEDRGIGIPADRIDAIFEPFVQVRADLARPVEGTGLGLAISRDLVRGMGGELGVESVEGRGSTFRIMLPVSPAP